MFAKKEQSLDSHEILDTVVSKPAGFNRENGVYHYIQDHLKNIRQVLNIEGFNLKASNNQQREAWYLSRSISASPPPVLQSLPLVEEHLSIDKNFCKQGLGLSPSHYTAVYENAEQGCIVHAYFDLDGNYIDCHIKKYVMSDKTKCMRMTDDENNKQSIKLQAEMHKNILKKLIEFKRVAYLDMYETTFRLNDEFSLLLEQPETKTNLRVIQSNVTEFKDKVRRIGFYNEMIDGDGRENFFSMIDMRVEQYLNRLYSALNPLNTKQTAVIVPASVVHAYEPALRDINVGNIPHVNVSSPLQRHHKQRDELKGENQCRTVNEAAFDACSDLDEKTDPHRRAYLDLIHRVDTHIDAFKRDNKRYVKQTTYAELLELQTKLIELQLMCRSHDIERGTKHKESQLKSIMNKMVVAFKSSIQEGDIELFKALHPGIEPYINLKQNYFDLLVNMDKVISITRLNNLISIANYLHSSSSVYRAVFNYFKVLFREISFDHHADGTLVSFCLNPLARAILNSDLDRAKMYLDQGVSADDDAFKISGQLVAYKPLYFIIFLAQHNVSYNIKKAVSLVNLLIEYGANLKMIKTNCLLASTMQMKQDQEKLGAHLSPEHLLQLDNTQAQMAKQNSVFDSIESDAQHSNLLTIAMRMDPTSCAVDYSLLMDALLGAARHADLKTLYIEFSRLVHYPICDPDLMFESQCMPFGVSKYGMPILSSKSAVSAVVRMPLSYRFVFKTGAPIRGVNEIIEVARIVCDKIHDMSSKMDRDAMRLFSLDLMRHAQSYQLERNVEMACITYFAGFLSKLTVINPEMSDYNDLLSFESFLLGSKKNRNIPIRMNIAELLKAQLPNEQQTQLEMLPSYRLCNKLAKDASVIVSASVVRSCELCSKSRTTDAETMTETAKSVPISSVSIFKPTPTTETVAQNTASKPTGQTHLMSNV